MRSIAFVAILLFAPRASAQSLRPHVEREGVLFRFVAGAEIVDVESDSWRATVQRVDDGALIVRVVRGDGYGGTNQGTQNRMSVCGRDAIRTIVHTERSESIGSYIDGDGMVQHLPPTIHPARVDISLTFVYRTVPFVITWSVDPERRAHYRSLEHAFFASIRCA